MTTSRRDPGPVLVGILLAAVLALIGGALASWRAWEATSPLPTAAEFAEIGRLVSPGDPAPFTRADPVRDDVADTGTVITVAEYGSAAPAPGRSLDGIRDRLKAAGWRIVGESSETYEGSTEANVVATRGHLRIFVIDSFWGNGGGLFTKVLREPTSVVTLAGLAGALAGAALGWGLVVWGDRRTRDHPLRRRALVLLTGVTLVLLIPAVAWTLYRALPDGVTEAHNYVQEPFWRGLTGEPTAVPALVAAVLALLVLVVPFPRRRA
ncbi:hypothetical protein [Cryptosporangium arvum]|uniref:hypothetical protein n=1 Tax=Cryptosporangium arvum TaxID=80871 RepID=UPI0012EDBCED|nr:hypothetical protein [Cryptosporangium arvum]